MLHITVVTFLIGVCSSFPTLKERERTDDSVSNENTNQDNERRTPGSTGGTRATGGVVGIGGFYQNPSLPAYQPFSPYATPTQVNPAFNPYALPTQVNPAFNPYAPPTQVNPAFNPYAPPTQVNPAYNPYAPPTQVNPYLQPTQPYAPVSPYPSSSQSNTALQSVLPFLLARLIPTPATPLSAPLIDEN
ncbi:uncharacterized protein LOC135256086 [Anguilla rostrata]|uniref:uncharacterized protein LOC135256086 n=1 Tax=Anguilla rostrata TaxID=7938 RepID=UPI0030CE1237